MKPALTLEESFLPDLCGVKPLFAVVIIGELLVFVLVVARAGFGGIALHELALLSLYVQWIGMSAAAVLCLSRRWLSRRGERVAAALSYGLVMTVAAAVCGLASFIVYPRGGDTALIALDARDFWLRTLSIAAIVAALVLRYFYVQHQWKQRTAAAATARLQALQARIRPHFLFNCMNTIASLTRSDAARAERAIEDLADLFRASLSDARHLVTLGSEIELVRRYLAIEGLRLGSRLAVEWATADLPDGARIPPLTLQPLVENAIYHGIEPSASGGLIRIDGRRDGERLTIEITNPVGVDGGRNGGNHIAQENVRQRLAAHFGERGRLDVECDRTGEGRYCARVSWPVIWT
ncbi:MAG: histidine kinase [Gammaproteobacteria bacterium]|nr:histidine kinase [Gammaproteobacteria bacterium]